MKGHVGRALRRQERYRTDEAFREKSKKWKKENYYKHREEIARRKKRWNFELDIFRNRKCLKCGKLLSYNTRGRLCKKHRWEKYLEKRKKIREKKRNVTTLKEKLINILKSIKPKSI